MRASPPLCTEIDSLSARALREIIIMHKFPRGSASADVWRHYDFRTTGTKSCIFARVIALRHKHRSALHIQRVVRGFFARIFVHSRGLSLREKCVNESDFCTLDAIRDIPSVLFFGYRDSSGFAHGFNLLSFVSLVCASREKLQVLNPYTREPIPWHIIWTANAVHRVSRLLFARHLPPLVDDTPLLTESVPIMRRGSPAHQRGSLAQQQRARTHVSALRRFSLEEREQHLFTEIELLGNHSRPEWFGELNAIEHMHMYNIMFDLWMHRLGLSNAIRRRICPLGNPFVGSTPLRSTQNDAFSETMRESCVFVIENMVMSGTEREYRKLGALYFLMALTCVRSSARESMLWLHEAIV